MKNEDFECLVAGFQRAVDDFGMMVERMRDTRPVTPASDAGEALRKDTEYLVSCALHHADKFPVPAHMRELCARITAALSTTGTSQDQGNG